MFGAEGVDDGGKALRDVGIAEMLADDGAVLGFGQAVVVGVARPGLVNSTRSLSSILAT